MSQIAGKLNMCVYVSTPHTLKHMSIPIFITQGNTVEPIFK